MRQAKGPDVQWCNCGASRQYCTSDDCAMNEDPNGPESTAIHEIASRAVPAGGSRPDADGERCAVVALPREGLVMTPRPDSVPTIGQFIGICSVGIVAFVSGLLVIALYGGSP